MKKYITLIAIFLVAIGLKSQTFTMTGSSASFFNSGKVTFTSDDGQFRTDADSDGNIANSGTISFRGAKGDGIYFSNTLGGDGTGAAGFTSDVRLTGWIYFSNTTGGNQTVQSRYYSNLGMENAATKVYVSNGSLAPTFVSGTYNVVSGSGSRDYSNNSTTFVYDGDSEQAVFAENTAGTSGKYYNLAFQNAGTKRVQAGDLVQVENEVRTEASATGGVTVNGEMWAENDFVLEQNSGQFLVDASTANASLTFGAGTGTIDGDLILDVSGVGGEEATAYTSGGGAVNINSTGSLALTSGTFNVANGPLNVNASSSMTLEGTGYLNVGASQTFYVAGNVNNQLAADGTSARNNTIYDDASFAVFEDVDVEETDENFPYGNLEVRATSGTMTIENGSSDKVFLSNNLAVNANSLNLLPNSSTLTMLDETATPAYDVATTEVVGMMARRTGGGSATLTFNNSEMKVNIGSGSGSVSEIALDSRPGTGNSDYEEARDVNRTVDMYHTSTGDFVAQMRFAYLDSEAPTTPTNEEDLRFREDQGGGTTEKVSTGFAPVRDATANPGLRWVQLDGLRRSGDNSGPTVFAQVDNGGTLFLRGGPTTFISINSGRWSNPDTWDEGEQPGYRDEAVVRHTVHIGYERQIDNDFSTNENVKLGNQRAGNTTADGIASRILIDGAYGDLSTTPSELATLLVGDNRTVALFPDPDGAESFDNPAGSLTLNPLQGTYTTTDLKDGNPNGITDNSVNTALEYNKGVVIFAGSTFVIYSGSMNNNYIDVDEGAELRITE